MKSGRWFRTFLRSAFLTEPTRGKIAEKESHTGGGKVHSRASAAEGLGEVDLNEGQPTEDSGDKEK